MLSCRRRSWLLAAGCFCCCAQCELLCGWHVVGRVVADCCCKSARQPGSNPWFRPLFCSSAAHAAHEVRAAQLTVGRSRSHQAACSRKHTDTRGKGIDTDRPVSRHERGTVLPVLGFAGVSVLRAGWQMQGWLAQPLPWPGQPGHLYLCACITLTLCRCLCTLGTLHSQAGSHR